MIMVNIVDNSTIDYTHIPCVSTEILTTDFSITRENTHPGWKCYEEQVQNGSVWLQEVRNSTPYRCISLASIGGGSGRILAETGENAIFIPFSKKENEGGGGGLGGRRQAATGLLS